MADQLEALRRTSRLVAHGTFDLDPARAREKLARYQLVEPQRYVLQFVQAAQLLGATTLEARIDADEVDLVFDGASPDAADLADIYLHAFGRRGIDRLEALRHIALGVIAAEAMDPASVQVETPHAVLVVERGDERVETREGQPQNRIYVRERRRLGHLVEFFRHLRHEPEEVVALRAAKHADVRIVVNRELINEATELTRAVPHVLVDNGLERGWLAVARRGDPAVALVQHGVVIEELALEIGSFRFAGVVSSRRLNTNLSQSAFVRNRSWDELFDEVLVPAALELSLRQVDRTLAGTDPLQVSAIVRAALECRVRHLRRGLAVPAIADEAVMALAAVSIWPRLRSRADDRTHVSTQELLAAAGPHGIVVSDFQADIDVLRLDSGEVAEHVLRVERRSDLPPSLLAEATERPLVDVGDRLRDLHASRSRASALHSVVYDRRGRPRIEDAATVRTATVASELVRVHAGIARLTVGAGATVVAAVAPRELYRVDIDPGPASGFVVLVVDEAERALPPAELVRSAAVEIADTLVESVMDLPRDHAPRAIVLPTLARFVRGRHRRAMCEALGWTAAELREVDEIDWADVPRVERARRLGAGASHLLFEIVGARRAVSLRDLVAPIAYVPLASRRRALQIEWELALVGSGRVLWLDEDGVELIAWFHGPDALQNVEDELRTNAARLHHERSGLREEPVLHGAFVFKRSLDGDGLRGELGLAQVDGSSFLEVVVLSEGKRVASRVIPVPNGQFRAIVDSMHLAPTADRGDVVEDEAWSALCARLQTVAHDLFELWCLQTLGRRERAPHETLALWGAVAAAGDSDLHRLDWRVFDAADGSALSLRELREKAEHIVAVVGNDPGDGFALRLPVAPAAHLALLRHLLGDVVLHRPPATHAPTPAPTESPRAEASLHPAAAILDDLGVRVDGLDLIDGAAGPILVDHHVLIGTDHPIGRAVADPALRRRAAVAIALVLTASDRTRLDAVVRRLRLCAGTGHRGDDGRS